MSVQRAILETVQRLCRERGNWTFTPDEVVRALPHLNPNTVRTHIVSRCCVNAPSHHVHRLAYFRRERRGVYELLDAVRPKTTASARRPGRRPSRPTKADSDVSVRDSVHAFIVREGDWYTADCAEIAVVTQGRTLDETIANLREAVGLHLEGEEAATLGIVSTPRLIVTIEVRPADAAA